MESQTETKTRKIILRLRGLLHKKRLIILFVAALVILVIGLGWFFIEQNTKTNSTKSASTKDQVAILLQKASDYRNGNELDKALESAIQADELSPSNYIESFIAEVYSIKNDTPNAIKYYQKAIGSIADDNPQANSLIDDYQKTIRHLNGEPDDSSIAD